jgi:hypothetical protein
MSDKRLMELGIPRRGFLKKTAAAAFVAPVVASFALDGIAEAGPGPGAGTFPNQRCPNQFLANQTVILHDLESAIGQLLQGTAARHIDFGQAHSLADKLVEAGLRAADGDTSTACSRLTDLIHELHQLEQDPRVYQPFLTTLLETVTELWQFGLRCPSCQ